MRPCSTPQARMLGRGSGTILVYATDRSRRTPVPARPRAGLFHCVAAAKPVKGARPLSRLLPTPASGTTARNSTLAADAPTGRILFHGVHHVALLCNNLERSLEFYCGILNLEINPDRPHEKLPYRGAWLWIGPEMIHLMELRNPDPLTGRPEHGGRDRHFCVGVESVEPIEAALKAAGIPYTRSMSGRAAIFFRDPDANCLECVELEAWRSET